MLLDAGGPRIDTGQRSGPGSTLGLNLCPQPIYTLTAARLIIWIDSDSHGGSHTCKRNTFVYKIKQHYRKG